LEISVLPDSTYAVGKNARLLSASPHPWPKATYLRPDIRGENKNPFALASMERGVGELIS